MAVSYWLPSIVKNIDRGHFLDDRSSYNTKIVQDPLGILNNLKEIYIMLMMSVSNNYSPF